MLYLFLMCWFGFVLTIVVVSVIAIARRGKAQITRYLQMRGAHNITVAYHWFSGDRYRNSYTVCYEDAAGVAHQTKCVTSNSLWGNQPIYWLDSPRGTEHVGVPDDVRHA